MSSMVSFWSESPCMTYPIAECCGDDSAITPGPAHRRQLCQPHPLSAACVRFTPGMGLSRGASRACVARVLDRLPA